MRVALLSAAAPDATGSMAIYTELVTHSLAAVAPGTELITVPLLRQPLTGGLSRLTAMAAARWRTGCMEADVYHWLDGSHAYMAGAISWPRTLISVHDFIPTLQAAGEFHNVAGPGWRARQLLTASTRAIQRCGAVCAVSESTASDLLRFTGRHADAVIPLCLRQLPAANTIEASLAPRPYILHVGHNGFYKNRSMVIAVFAALAKQFPNLHLVLAGEAVNNHLQQQVQATGLSKRVHWLDSPSDDSLAQLYSDAEMLLFPSLYEGFGWPPLEAMAYGCPVVCSNTGSLPEVVSNAALTCSPCDLEALTRSCTKLLKDSSLRSDLISRGKANLARFSLEHMGKQLFSLYTQLQRRAGACPSAT
jgi:glycosyltransferase involved in cell wall biosynthesis